MELEGKRVLSSIRLKVPEIIHENFSGSNELPIEVGEFWEIEWTLW